MADLRKDFKYWLITHSCKERTAYEYVKRIDRICNKLFNNHRDWETLAQSIHPVLLLYLLCPTQTLSKPTDLNTICRLLSEKNILSIIKQFFDDFRLYISFDDFLFWLWNESKGKRLNKTAVLKFYHFLQGTECHEIDIITLKPLNFDDICNHLSNIVTHQGLFNIEVQEYANEHNAKTVVPRKDSFTKKTSDFLGIKDSSDSLECSPKTFKRIVKNQYKQKNEKFSLDYDDNRKCTNFEDIQAYLKEHHHPSGHTYQAGTYNSQSKNNWCNAQEAADIIGCSVSTVIQYRKDGELTYTDYTPRHVLYFIPDVERIRDERKQNGRRTKKH